MKRSCAFVVLLAAAALLMPIAGRQVAVAQIPPGVTVDSIAPASDWTNLFPVRAHNIAADPKTGKVAFVAGTGGTGSNPIWMYSPDNGTTWSSLTGFLPSGAGRVAIAADSNFQCYITYRVAYPSGAIGIIFDKDPNGDGTGLGSPVLVNDTSVDRIPNYPDISVSPDGQHILISAIDFTFSGGRHNVANGLCRVYASSDGGTTWTMHPVVDPRDPAITPKSVDSVGFMWYGPSVNLGSNGYGFFLISTQYDTTDPATPYWEVITETHDYGQTWSTPSWVTLPPASEYIPGTDFSQYSPGIAIDTIPHFADAMSKPGGQRELVEFHKENGSWVYHAISHWDPITTSFNFGQQGSLGVDANGNLYAFFGDRNESVIPPGRIFGDFQTFQLYVSGSSDGGNTWTPAVRLTGTEPILVGDSAALHTASITRFPPRVSSSALGIVTNGVSPGLYGVQNGVPIISAWVSVRFPLGVAWTGPYDQDARTPKAGGYVLSAKGASDFHWYEISGSGTKVTGFYNGSLPSDGGARDDGTAGPFPIGFPFTFFGQSYSQFWVGANGLVSFTDSVLNTAATQPSPKDSLGFFNSSYNFPGPGNPFHTVIAAYYNDLDLIPHASDGTGHGDVYYWKNAANDTCVIEWYQAGDFNAPDDTVLTFEVVLAKADSSVSVFFANIGNTGTEKTSKVGIQAVDSVGVFYTVGSYPLDDTPAPGTGATWKPSGVTSVAQSSSTVPQVFELYQNYPNPFNPSTVVAYSIPRASNVTLAVYNVLGQKVATLVDGRQSAGNYQVRWNAENMGTGVYFYQLQADGHVISVKKALLLK